MFALGPGDLKYDEIFGGSNAFAITLNSFVFGLGTDGPGIINGVELLSSVVGGVDIYFNTSQQLGIVSDPTAQGGGPYPAPEPGTVILLASGLAGLFGLRRMQQHSH